MKKIHLLLIIQFIVLSFTNVFADYPVVSHSYLADPGVLVHEGRVYVYCSNDNENGDDGYAMSSIVCVSSADLKNWTYHGVVLDVPRDAGWAVNTWAPSPAYKNGQFYLYFANNASNVGVSVADSPTGPFTDPIGEPLLTGSTPGVQPFDGWLFDPMTFIDDDGQAYCYFGGNGDDNMRAIRLNDDMVSTQGEAVSWNVPNFFEAAWMHKYEGTYYFSYSTTTDAGIRIDYMTSDSPMSGFTYGGVMSPQPPNNNNNNHQATFEYNGEWYQMYHNRIVATENGIDPVYHRNLAIDRFVHNPDGSIQEMQNTVDGVEQQGYLDPFVRVEAETMSDQNGIDTEPSNQGGFNLTLLNNNDWTMVEGVDFGSAGASSFSASVASDKTGGSIEIRLGGPSGTLIGTVSVPNTGGMQSWQTVTTSVNQTTGVHDVYFVFKGNTNNLFSFDHWAFLSSGPIVSITDPSDGDVYFTGDDITINATAEAQEGSVTQVEFFIDGTSVGIDDTAPYSYTYTNASQGDHTITAVALDSQGDDGTAEITISVNVPQGPYNETPHTIPGTIELEEFDVGGNGYAYSDDTPGSETEVDYRTDEDVDIEESTDEGGGYNLGWTTAGEWLEYTTEVTTPGIYELEIRVAADGADRTVSIAMDGEEIATDVAIPNTGGWQMWQTVTVEDITLQPGEKVMRLTIGETDYVNLNYVTFNLVEEFVQEPYNGTAHNIPGRIEAEEYDLGGEGLGYHEANANGNEGDATFRDDEVDIEATTDTDGEYNIAYTLTGEWLEYTVDVQNTADYDLEVRVARDGDDGVFHVEMDGEDVTGPIDVPNTGGWQVWETVAVNDVPLTAGEQEMRIVFDSDYTNLNYITFAGIITGNMNAEIGNNDFSVYPNPFTEWITVDVPEEGSITVIDAKGAVLKSFDVTAGEHPVQLNQEKGLYQLIYHHGNKQRLIKVMKY